jgi:endonuclease YncB( thermonuclease family)
VNTTLRHATVGALACLILASASLVVSAAGVAGETRGSETAVVASVYDGDTLSLRDGRRVRLLQIDTPELGSGECYSRAARTALLRLTPIGRAVVLETDPGLDRTDRYRRLLRYVKRNGVNVNLELVRRGAAASVLLPRRQRPLCSHPLPSSAARTGVEAGALERVSVDCPRPLPRSLDWEERTTDPNAPSNRQV